MIIHKHAIRKTVKKLLLICLAVCSLLGLASCESTDKTKSGFDAQELNSVVFDYIEKTDQTKITWVSTIRNDTIYNMKSFSVTFDLFENSSLVKTDIYSFDCDIAHGDSHTDTFYFYCDGKIDGIRYLSSTATYDSFWSTYWLLIIITIVGTIVLSAGCIVLIYVTDIDDEIFDFLPLIVVLPILLPIYLFCVFNWVSVLIIMAGIEVVALSPFIAYWIFQ